MEKVEIAVVTKCNYAKNIANKLGVQIIEEPSNLGLSNANITKLELAKKIQKYLPYVKIKKTLNKRDPDQRDYFVSNKKIENIGFKAKISLDKGIQELIKLYKVNTNFKNNY